MESSLRNAVKPLITYLEWMETLNAQGELSEPLEDNQNVAHLDGSTGTMRITVGMLKRIRVAYNEIPTLNAND